MKSLVALSLLLSAVWIAQTPPPASTPGPSSEVPELQALKTYAGQWTTEWTVKPTADQTKALTAKGSTVTDWIHDGRFLRQTWSMDEVDTLSKLNGSSIMTYDSRKQSYRIWQFMSNGSTGDGEGSWDAAAKTMSWTVRDGDGSTMYIKTTFSADGAATFNITINNQEGKQVAELTGKNTPKKK